MERPAFTSKIVTERKCLDRAPRAGTAVVYARDQLKRVHRCRAHFGYLSGRGRSPVRHLSAGPEDDLGRGAMAGPASRVIEEAQASEPAEQVC